MKPSTAQMQTALIATLFASWLLAGATSARGVVTLEDETTLDFSSEEVAANSATWTRDSSIDVTAQGLGPTTEVRDIQIETKAPIAIGYITRPAGGVKIEAEVHRSRRNGMVVRHVSAGTLSMRYSADAQHWSDWIIVPVLLPYSQTLSQYSLSAKVPYEDARRYFDLLAESGMNDQEKFVQQLIQKEPRFFEAPPPFMGYLQFRYKTELDPGQRIRSIRIRHFVVLSGHNLVDPPDVMTGRKHAWRFKAQGKIEDIRPATQPATQPARNNSATADHVAVPVD